MATLNEAPTTLAAMVLSDKVYNYQNGPTEAPPGWEPVRIGSDHQALIKYQNDSGSLAITFMRPLLDAQGNPVLTANGNKVPAEVMIINRGDF